MPNNNPQQQTTPQQQIARAAEGASKAAERLGESAEQATSVAIEKVRQVRDEAQSGIEHQRDQVAERIRRLSGVLRAGSQTLSTDDPLAQQLFDTAGERIEQVADYIGNITPGGLADDVTSLARRRPGLFFGGSFILGLALGRFVKSSASVASGSYEADDEYDDTLAVRPAKRGGSRKQRRAQQNAQGRTQSAQASSASTNQRSPGSSSSGEQPSTGKPSASSASPSASSASPSAGSTSTGTVGSGSSHGPSSTPSYGASSAVTTASKPQTSSSHTAASSTPRDVERGEGNKS